MHSSDAHGHGFLKNYAYEYVVPHLYHVYEYAYVYGCVREYAPNHHDYAHVYGSSFLVRDSFLLSFPTAFVMPT